MNSNKPTATNRTVNPTRTASVPVRFAEATVLTRTGSMDIATTTAIIEPTNPVTNSLTSAMLTELLLSEPELKALYKKNTYIKV